MLNRVAIFSSGMSDRTIRVINHLIEDFCRKNVRIYLYDKSDEYKSCRDDYKIEKFTFIEVLTEKPDLVLSVGGDGTFLETIIYVKDMEVPVA
ncbi:MAG: hypothetical protein ACUVTX_11865, partial [Bacteroidales bacterium]